MRAPALRSLLWLLFWLLFWLPRRPPFRRALWLLLALPAAAQEYVEVPGRLDDAAFYRAVACAAPPGGACRKPFLRWPEARRGDLTVGLVPLAEGPPPDLYRRDLDAALAEVNGLDAGLRLRRTRGRADIEVHVVDTPPGHVMRGTGIADLDGQVLPLGRVSLRTRGGIIREALVAISSYAGPGEVAPILLEEIVQGLGLITDIKSPAYGDSLFSEERNDVVRLEAQDAMALRRHYARDGGQGGVQDGVQDGGGEGR